MDWQQIAALALVGVVLGTALFIRNRQRRSGRCGAGCCPTTPRAELRNAGYDASSKAHPHPEPQSVRPSETRN
ncbi:MAG: hypothetical protein AB7O66_08065 [Limisphaerales bacterium]